MRAARSAAVGAAADGTDFPALGAAPISRAVKAVQHRHLVSVSYFLRPDGRDGLRRPEWHAVVARRRRRDPCQRREIRRYMTARCSGAEGRARRRSAYGEFQHFTNKGGDRRGGKLRGRNRNEGTSAIMHCVWNSGETAPCRSGFNYAIAGFWV